MRRIPLTVIEDSQGNSVQAPMIRGYAWPFTGTRKIRLKYSEGWTPGVEDNWTWTLRIHAEEGGGEPELELTASSATITGDSNEYLILEFSATATESTLSGDGHKRFLADLEADPGGDADKSIWPIGFYLDVRNEVGEGA